MSLGLAMGSEENEGSELMGVHTPTVWDPYCKDPYIRKPGMFANFPQHERHTGDFKLKGPQRTHGVTRIARV